MPFFIISVIFQVLFVIHIVKTGRSTTWIWIVVMLPLAGSIAYLIIEVLPGMTGGRTAGKVKSSVEDVINPNKDMKSAAKDFSKAGTVENTIKFAEEMINKRMYEEAKQLYQNILKGIYEHDPIIMSGLARAEFGLKNYQSVKKILDKLIENNPEYKNQESHLLYARAAEGLDDVELARDEYEALNGYYSGPEATYRYAIFLRNNGNTQKSSELITKILRHSETAGKHYNSMHKEWITLARNEYNG